MPAHAEIPALIPTVTSMGEHGATSIP